MARSTASLSSTRTSIAASAQESRDLAGGGYRFGAAGVAHEQHASAHDGPSAMARAKITIVQRRRSGTQPQEVLDVPGRTWQRARNDAADTEAKTSAARATPRTAAARTCGSRTTPPEPTFSRPASNWGFTISTRSASLASDPDQGRQDRP